MQRSRRDHWNRVYATKEPHEVSWHQADHATSLRLIAKTGVQSDDPVLDVGGGTSTLVDSLHKQGFSDITVLDVSTEALERARCRMGSRGETVDWITSDVTTFSPQRRYTIWHDRAVFHFLINAQDRERYVDAVLAALQPQGHLILATFGPDGPLRCSGLETRRYGIEQLHAVFDEHFELKAHELEDHVTPSGSSQQFIYSCWRVKTQ